MKTIREQISCKCIHFNGVMNQSCKAGVNYADVRIGKPYKFPCLQTGGECSKAEFLTPEQVEQQEREMMEDAAKVLEMNARIIDHFTKTGKRSDTIECSCGGQITYAIADNGHKRAHCSNCKKSFME